MSDRPSTPGPTPSAFETRLQIDAPRDAVWRALADATEIQRWFAPEASVEPRVGGKLVWRWQGLHEWTCRIETWQSGERMLLRYDSAVDDGGGGHKPLFVDFVLGGEGGATTLRLVHSGFGPEAEFANEYTGISRGWPVELRSLKLYLERHRGQDRRTTWVTHPTHKTPAATWAEFVGPRGLVGGAGIDALAEGAPFSFRTSNGLAFEGSALRCNPREFTGVAENLGGAWVRISVETFSGEPSLWFWISTYGEPQEAAERRTALVRSFLAGLFPAPVANERQA